MARINLRPWREERRKERNKQFGIAIASVAILSMGLGFLWHQQVESQVEYQNSRNSYLSAEMAKLDKQIAEIRELRKRRDELLSRMRVIQDLQGKRPVIVRVFDEVVRTLPEGVHYDHMAQTGNTLKVKGVAEANSRIATLMRNLDASEWFDSPMLTSVKALQNDPSQSSFELSVKQITPDDGEKKGEKR